MVAVGVGFELFVRVEPGGVPGRPADDGNAGAGNGTGADVVRVLDWVGGVSVIVLTGTTGTTGTTGSGGTPLVGDA